MYNSEYIENLYNGYCATETLWKGIFNEIMQLDIDTKSESSFLRNILKKRRLGQLAEQFVFNQFEHLGHCEILAKNVQIRKDKQTIGEIDALINLDSKPIHIEIVYKFYVYDDTLGESEIERWIGPNRKDSLTEKIIKLKNKQFPLLYSTECRSVLDTLGLDLNSIKQQVVFKAQLFIPYQKSVNFCQLNEACVCGFYINMLQLSDFSKCEFYIPAKLDWFLNPSNLVDWLSFETFKLKVEIYLNDSKSPLIWIKQPDEKLLKSFLVWW